MSGGGTVKRTYQPNNRKKANAVDDRRLVDRFWNRVEKALRYLEAQTGTSAVDDDQTEPDG